jgi:hypothetical protein
MQQWIMMQKRTVDWASTIRTANIVYAMLLMNHQNNNNDNDIIMTLGSSELCINKENTAYGYYSSNIACDEVTPDKGNITVESHSDKISYGSVCWHYMTDIENVGASDSHAMKIVKRFILKDSTGNVKAANSEPKVGDIMTTVLTIDSRGSYDYIHIKDDRPACFEPIEQLSGFHYHDLLYYQTVRDASVNFFIEHLPKGKFEITYDCRINNKGTYISGISSMQCMYAPEFCCYSSTDSVTIEE